MLIWKWLKCHRFWRITILKIVEISVCMHIRHYRLINAIPADIGQIFRYWMIYQKTFLWNLIYNNFFLVWDLSKKTCLRKSLIDINQKCQKTDFVISFFINTCFIFQKMLIVEQTRGIKREILCFKSGEERIIENGPGVFDFKGRKIAQNARTFIFTADKNPFNQSSQSIKSCDIQWEKDETLICKSKPQF